MELCVDFLKGMGLNLPFLCKMSSCVWIRREEPTHNSNFCSLLTIILKTRKHTEIHTICFMYLPGVFGTVNHWIAPMPGALTKRNGISRSLCVLKACFIVLRTGWLFAPSSNRTSFFPSFSDLWSGIRLPSGLPGKLPCLLRRELWRFRVSGLRPVR